MGHEPGSTTSGQGIGEPECWHGIGIDGEGGSEQSAELGEILLAHGHRLGQRQIH